MGCRRVNSCCCGCSLKQGCIIIGVVYIILDLLAVGNAAYNHYNVYSGLKIAYIIITLLFLAMPIILIWGAVQAKASFVKVAFIIFVIQLVVNIIFMIIYTVIIIDTWNFFAGMIYLGVGLAMTAAWFIYPAMVIWSHYKELEGGFGAGTVHAMY